MTTRGPDDPDIVATKLVPPRVPPGAIARPRLAQLLDRALGAELTLVSAAAGYGKTTLLAWYFQQSPRPVAWLSLEAADNEPRRFWTYVLEALARQGVGRRALQVLRARSGASLEPVLTELVNDLAASSADTVLVLDDYHLVEHSVIHAGVTFLLEHLPANAHLVISTRSDPPLHLARLRGRAQVVDLRNLDLRLTLSEAHEFLAQTMGLALPDEVVEALEARTDGWLVGLQLAAHLVRGGADVTEFGDRFGGGPRAVLDFLSQEVLANEPEAVTSFLLETSCLDRLCGDLCDAVTGRADGQEMLQHLERRNLFVTALDTEGTWYGYHQLFADVLRHQLDRRHPERRAELERRASRWHEERGQVADAIRYALAAGDSDEAARLVAEQAPRMFERAELATLRAWLEVLPGSALRARPELAVAHAALALSTQDLATVQARLGDLEAALAAGTTSSSPSWLGDIAGSAAAIRSNLAWMTEDPAAVVRLAREALATLPADSWLWRAVTAVNLALAAWRTGGLDEAVAVLEAGPFETHRFPGDLVLLGAKYVTLGQVRALRGDLTAAQRAYQQLLALATDPTGCPLPVAGWAHTGLAGLALEMNDLAAAAEHLDIGVPLSEQAGDGVYLADAYVTAAYVRHALGDEDGTTAAMNDAAQRIDVVRAQRPQNPVDAHLAKLWLWRGDLDRARRWARECGLRWDDELAYVQETGHITLARVLLAEGRPEQATGLLRRLEEAAARGGRVTPLVEVLVVLAVGLYRVGDLGAALDALGRALELAEPGGHVRVFIAEGDPMVALLERAFVTDLRRRQVQALLAAAGRTPGTTTASTPLTPREREVLRLLAAGASTVEIANQLFLSEATVKKHTTHIFAKLGARRRTQAIARARDLGILPT